MTALTTLLYPELAGFAPDERDRALERARRRPLDWVELAGLGFAVVGVALLTRYGVDGLALLERLSAATANFVLAVPLLAVAASLPPGDGKPGKLPCPPRPRSLRKPLP